ncbi:unnamed protein product [Musa acuminata subsp. burmannicoides]|uniref:(wild Malaysian banana) hypothetical protein n=1 Tax=Musa acuminata subsp. malaccensis TaxID=214687 RepID=A0A804KHH7_MUSAM|nr:unnamed protein product [Musa acuminata subsp. malaccensis]
MDMIKLAKFNIDQFCPHQRILCFCFYSADHRRHHFFLPRKKVSISHGSCKVRIHRLMLKFQGGIHKIHLPMGCVCS